MAKTVGIDVIDIMACEIEFDPEQIAQVLNSTVEMIEDPEMIKALGKERTRNTRQIRLYNRLRKTWGWLILNLSRRFVNFCTETPTEAAKVNVIRPSPEFILIEPADDSAVLVNVPFSFVGLPKVTMVKVRPEHQTVFFVSERKDCFIILEVQGDCQHKVYVKDK